MASKPTVTLTFAGDEKNLSDKMRKLSEQAQDMNSRVGRAGSEMADKTQASAGRMSKAMQNAGSILIAQGAMFAAQAGVDFFKGMVSEAREAEKISRSTAQGIATIGAASWTSVEAISALSEKISNKIGVDDEAIQQSANLLLTFKNVTNQAGAMNNIFDRSVMAAQDLAAKGFGDADSAAKMLGKALNDPIKGMTALSKAGVTFSEDQKKQIKNMVEHGDLLGAQKLLLAEVEAQVGGTAEATASAGDKMAVTWANFQESLGETVLPILDDVLGKLMEFLDWAQRNPEIVAALAAITGGIWLLNFALAANPIVLVAALVAALVAGLMILWTQSAGFRQFFIDMWNGIRGVVNSVVDGIVDRWNAVIGFFRGLPGAIGQAIGSLGDIVGSVFKGAANAAIDGINWMIRRANDMIYGINVVNPFNNIPYIPQVARLHRGGEVLGLPGQEHLAMLKTGETVVSGDSQGGGSAELRLVISGSGGLAEAISYGIRVGDVRLEVDGRRVEVA